MDLGIVSKDFISRIWFWKSVSEMDLEIGFKESKFRIWFGNPVHWENYLRELRVILRHKTAIWYCPFGKQSVLPRVSNTLDSSSLGCLNMKVNSIGRCSRPTRGFNHHCSLLEITAVSVSFEICHCLALLCIVVAPALTAGLTMILLGPPPPPFLPDSNNNNNTANVPLHNDDVLSNALRSNALTVAPGLESGWTAIFGENERRTAPNEHWQLFLFFVDSRVTLICMFSRTLNMEFGYSMNKS